MTLHLFTNQLSPRSVGPLLIAKIDKTIIETRAAEMPDSMMFETLVDLRDQPFATLEKPTLSSVNLSYSMDELHLNSYFSASRAFEFPERNLVKNSRTQFLAFRRRSMSSPTDPSLQRIESFQQEFEALLQSSASAHSVHSFLKNCRERRGSVSETITTEVSYPHWQ